MVSMKDLPQDEAQWRDRLTPEQYAVLRGKGTEAPFTGELLHEQRAGMYNCAACGQQLFTSDTKFDSGSGWPSFDKAIPTAVTLVDDNSHSMRRTEVLCSRCGSHLGHLFTDGPTPTGQRFCMNSVSLEFAAQDAKDLDEYTKKHQQ